MSMVRTKVSLLVQECIDEDALTAKAESRYDDEEDTPANSLGVTLAHALTMLDLWLPERAMGTLARAVASVAIHEEMRMHRHGCPALADALDRMIVAADDYVKAVRELRAPDAECPPPPSN